LVYRSLVSNNDDIPPPPWLSLGAVSAALSDPLSHRLWPRVAGRHAQRLPAPERLPAQSAQDPKAGVISYLGAPQQMAENDYIEENGLIVSGLSDLIVLRFVASVTRVPKFDPMFCEGLARG
jgi:hypothetical protein